MLKPEAAELVKGMTGLNDEQVAKLHSGHAKLFNNVMDSIQYQTVAEVIKSEFCFAQVKVGDKLVFDPFLNPAKSTGVMCPKALLPVVAQIGAIWEMSAEWANSGREGVPEIIWRNIRCLDPGLENGGLGGVVYSIRLEPMTT
jgi:hypothetical protein